MSILLIPSTYWSSQYGVPCRPHRRNAVNKATGERLAAAFEAFEADETSRVAVLYGANNTFCAGYDLHEVASLGGMVAAASSGTSSSSSGSAGTPPALFSPVGDGPGPMGPSRMELRKPLIAAVAGHAVAGGLELSLLADMRVAEETAVFGVFCRRFGVPLIDGGTVRLPALIGLSRALDLILTGRPVPAPEALSLGLVNRVVAPCQALPEAIKLAQTIAAFPNEVREEGFYGCLESDFLSVDFTYQRLLSRRN